MQDIWSRVDRTSSAQLADSANIAHFSADATRYFSGEFIFMIFGLPGAALAMFKCAKQEKKNRQEAFAFSNTCMYVYRNHRAS